MNNFNMKMLGITESFPQRKNFFLNNEKFIIFGQLFFCVIDSQNRIVTIRKITELSLRLKKAGSLAHFKHLRCNSWFEALLCGTCYVAS